MTTLEPRRLRANGLLLLASAIWGFAFVAQRVGAATMGSFSFNAVRFAMGALSLVPAVAWLDRRRGVTAAQRRTAARAVIIPGLLTGTLLAVAVGLQQAALSYTTAGNAAFITGLYMVLVPVVAALRGHRSSVATVVGICAALLGLFLISVTDSFTINPGDLLVLASTFVWAAQILVIDHFSSQLSVLRYSIAQFLWCALLSGAVALVVEPDPFGGIPDTVVPLLYGGLVSVGVAYTLQVVAQRDALASHAALIMSAEAVFGALGGALFLGENMGARGYLGAALMVLGIGVAQVPVQSLPRSGAEADGALT